MTGTLKGLDGYISAIIDRCIFIATLFKRICIRNEFKFLSDCLIMPKGSGNKRREIIVQTLPGFVEVD